ncbi:MAG: S49 family peptidase, partial [Nannocystaceae bacterium]
AAEKLWDAVSYAKQRKPILVSMGSFAAAGGYYFSCNATKIYANATTLTGAIGALAGQMPYNELLKEDGRGYHREKWPVYAPVNVKKIKSAVKEVETNFIRRVSRSRGIPLDSVRSIAQGRIWNGSEAIDHDLVDEFGTLADALADARHLGQVGESVDLEIYPPPRGPIDHKTASIPQWYELYDWLIHGPEEELYGLRGGAPFVQLRAEPVLLASPVIAGDLQP